MDDCLKNKKVPLKNGKNQISLICLLRLFNIYKKNKNKMTIEIIEGFYIEVTAEAGKELVNKNETPEIRTKKIYVPLEGDYSMWIEEDEAIEPIV
jgi:hypothetical protein